jgi:flagellar biosynthesis protein FliQ
MVVVVVVVGVVVVATAVQEKCITFIPTSEDCITFTALSLKEGKEVIGPQ